MHTNFRQDLSSGTSDIVHGVRALCSRNCEVATSPVRSDLHCSSRFLSNLFRSVPRSCTRIFGKIYQVERPISCMEFVHSVREIAKLRRVQCVQIFIDLDETSQTCSVRCRGHAHEFSARSIKWNVRYRAWSSCTLFEKLRSCDESSAFRSSLLFALLI